MAFVSSYHVLLLSLLMFHASAPEPSKYHASCLPFYCGKLGKISFPFTNATHPDCGLVVVDGCIEPVQRIQLERGGRWYQVENISQTNTILIHDKLLLIHLQSRGCDTFSNLTLPSSPYLSFQITPNLTMFRCSDTFNNTLGLDFNYTGCKGYNIFFGHLDDSVPSLPLPSCSILQLPLSRAESYYDVFGLLAATYTLEVHISSVCYKCFYRGGRCELDIMGKFHCAATKEGNRGLLGHKSQIVAAAVGIGVLMVLVCCIRKIFSCDKFIFPWKKETQIRPSTEAALKKYGPLIPKRYSYSEVRKMTKCFRDKLGQGGYGSVFKGNLPDGCLVAVKVLNESKSNGEEFINEVAIISRTSHVNIVTLLGFCFEGPKQALVYEFMSKGSLEKFICEETSLKPHCQLDWQKLYQIAVGIAQGLEYLHRGCNMRICHFDIKPHNILLDDEFCPKISDFGLAKICPRKESIVSMSSARGTAGYIAPEVFCRNFGEVSHKSDVYSYGMLVLEMAGGRKNVHVGIESPSEKYFPHLIHKQLEQGEELGLQGILDEEDKVSARKMTVVGLWCIQTDPKNRPPISKVVEMLEGNIESLEIPPKPFLSSPPRPQPNSSITSVSRQF